MEKQLSMFEKFFSSKVTQIISIGTVLLTFINYVIFPIRDIQLSQKIVLANQAEAKEDKKETDKSFDARITQNTNDVLVLKTVLLKYNIK